MQSRMRLGRRLAVVVALAALIAPFAAMTEAGAATRSLSNGPTIRYGTKSICCNPVHMGQITKIPTAGVTTVDVKMTVGPRATPYATSATKYGQRLHDYPEITAFATYAAGNRIDIRGNHYYDANVDPLT